MRTKWVLLIVLIMTSIALQPAEAKKHKHSKGDVRGMVVTSVDIAHSKIVLTIEHNKQALTYMVPIGTTLTIDGEPTSLAGIQQGMHVVSYTDADGGTLSQLDVSRNPNAGK